MRLCRFWLAVITAFFATLGIQAAARAASPPALGTNQGRDFWLVFPSAFTGETRQAQLQITAVQASVVRVEISGIGWMEDVLVPSHGAATVNLPMEAFIQIGLGEQYDNNGIHVTADHDVAVCGSYDQTYGSEAFMALPLEALSSSYLFLSYGQFSSEFALVASMDNTVVTITPTTAFYGHPAAVPYTITLDRGQRYQVHAIAPITDLSGTTVSADHPLTMIGGCDWSTVPLGTASTNPLFEQMPPVLAMGKRFITTPFASRMEDRIRVYAIADTTRVQVDGQSVATLDAGQWYEQVLTAPLLLTSDKAIFVAQFATGSDLDHVDGDPMMVVVPPIDEYVSDCIVMSPAVGAVNAHFVNIVAPDSAASTITLDGSAVSGFTSIGWTGYSFAQVSVSGGVHEIASSTGAKLGVSVYGFGPYDSYGYWGGVDFRGRTGEMYVTAKPLSVIAGTSSTGKVTIPYPAPVGGTLAILTSSDPAVASVPASVTIGEGLTTATFEITSHTVTSAHMVTIAASGDGLSNSSQVNVVPNTVASLTFNPPTVAGGNTARATLQLAGPSASGGTTVFLTSGNSAIAPVASSVTVPAGAISVSFSISTRAVSSNASVDISATLNGIVRTGTLNITPVRLLSVTLSSTAVFERGSVTGLVTLDAPAPSGGAVVALASSNAGAATVPSSVTVPQGSLSKTFTVTAKTVTSTQSTTITGNWRGILKSQNLSVSPITLASIQMVQSTVTGGTAVNGVVRIPVAAPPGGLVVSLSSSYPTIARVPSSITIAQNATSGTFAVTSYPVGQTIFATITAKHATSVLSTQFQILPPEVSSFTLSTYTTRGGNSISGTVRLTGKAPTGGLVVQISAYPTLAAPTATVTVAAGSTSRTFTIATSHVSATTQVLLTARTFSLQRQVALTLTP